MSTIADVAARAGVSKATASRALSGRGYVSRATRDRVATAADELAYVAHHAATSLATGRTQSVAVVVPTVDRWFFAELIDGIQSVLLDTDHDLTLFSLREGSHRRARIFSEVLPRRRFDGVIAIELQPEAHELEQLARMGMPLVSVGAHTGESSAISINDEQTARIATEHLIGLGHHDIAFLGGSAAHPGLGDERRLSGYVAAMNASGLSAHIRHAASETTMPGSYRVATTLLSDRRERPTAILGVCDEAAIGALIAARRLGIAVPSELSVIGIDDHTYADMFGLTTMRQEPRAQGIEAVRLLQERIQDAAASAEHVVAPAALVIRSSTSVPPGR